MLECYRSFPWLNELATQFPEVVFIGIHSPEFDHEKDVAAVDHKSEQFGLNHASLIDNDFSYWRALGNRYWPAWYLVDRDGNIAAHYIGETHTGDAQATAIAQRLTTLLAEE